MKKTLSIMLAGVLCTGACAFAACQEEPVVTEETEQNFISLADFEEWGPDFQMLRLINNFGKVTRNKDEAFIKEGKYSAKLQPVGGYLSGTKPLLYIPTKSSLFEYDYQDFTKYDNISAYFYNDSENAIDVTIGLVNSITSGTVVSTVSGDTIKLEPKKWQRVDYWLSHNLLGLSTDLTKIEGVYFEFPNQGVLNPDEAPTVYMDDVRILKNDGNKEIVDLVKLDEGELLSFEKDYQKYVYRSELKGLPQENFELSVVKASDFGITAPNGENVLHVLHHSGPNFGKIFFSQRLLQVLGIANVPEEKYKTTYLRFDVYGADYQASDDYVTFQFSQEGGKGLKYPWKVREADSPSGAYKKGEWYTYGGSHYYKPNEWTTYSVSLYELFKTGEEYVKNPGEFAVWINANLDGEDRHLFLDNFRMEEGEELFVVEEE